MPPNAPRPSSARASSKHARGASKDAELKTDPIEARAAFRRSKNGTSSFSQGSSASLTDRRAFATSTTSLKAWEPNPSLSAELSPHSTRGKPVTQSLEERRAFNTSTRGGWTESKTDKNLRRGGTSARKLKGNNQDSESKHAELDAEQAEARAAAFRRSKGTSSSSSSSSNRGSSTSLTNRRAFSTSTRSLKAWEPNPSLGAEVEPRSTRGEQKTKSLEERRAFGVSTRKKSWAEISSLAPLPIDRVPSPKLEKPKSKTVAERRAFSTSTSTDWKSEMKPNTLAGGDKAYARSRTRRRSHARGSDLGRPVQ